MLRPLFLTPLKLSAGPTPLDRVWTYLQRLRRGSEFAAGITGQTSSFWIVEACGRERILPICRSMTNGQRGACGRRKRRERGQSLLEFALALPLLAVILFGLTDFGLAYFNEISITSAARTGARVAAVTAQGSGTTQAQAAISDAARDLVGCNLNTSAITISPQYDQAGIIDQWTVTVSCTYSPVTPLGTLLAYFGGSSGSTFQIKQTAVMRDSQCSPSGGQADCRIP